MSLLHFNPHPYVRDDFFNRFFHILTLNFNPHPYVRDDPELADEEELPFYFNPHPYVRDDMCHMAARKVKVGFQSTSLREG